MLQFLKARSIYGNIKSLHTSFNHVSTIWRVETGAGPFVGSLACNTLTSGTNPGGIVVSGDGTPANGILNADISITNLGLQPISATGGLAAGRTIKIAGSYSQNITNLPSGGLHGQVIVNANNGSGTWGGSLTAGTTTVSGYYTATNLGEGAIGAVPFHVQGAECFPPSGATVPVPTNGSTLYYTFYGPVKRATTGVKPVVISRRPIVIDPPLAPWEDVSADFDMTESGRSVEITHTTASGTHPWLVSGYQYKIEPKTDASVTLICDQLITGTANTPVFSDSNAPYMFYVDSGVVVTCDGGC